MIILFCNNYDNYSITIKIRYILCYRNCFDFVTETVLKHCLKFSLQAKKFEEMRYSVFTNEGCMIFSDHSY